MSHWLEQVRLLLESESSDLRALALMCRSDPRTFYLGADLNGVDLRGQDVRGLEFTGLSEAAVLFDEATRFDPQQLAGLEAGGWRAAQGNATEEDEEGHPPHSPVAGNVLYGAIDLGSEAIKVMCVNEHHYREGAVPLDNLHIAPSTGLAGRRGVDSFRMGECILRAVEAVEARLMREVASVTIATSVGELSSIILDGDVSLGTRAIGDTELVRAIQAALSSLRLPGRRALHLLPTQWIVDGKTGIRDPRAMFGRRLGVELFVVTMDEEAFRNVVAAVQFARLKLDAIVAAPLVAALSVLSDHELDGETIVLDLGASFTSAVLFSKGSAIRLESMPFGLGTAGPKARSPDYPLASQHGERVLAERLEAVMMNLRDRLFADGASTGAVTRIVLTGGGARYALASEVAERIFRNRSVRAASPVRRPGAGPDPGPELAAVAGVVRRAAYGPREAVASAALVSAQVRRPPIEEGGNPLVRTARWLRENF